MVRDLFGASITLSDNEIVRPFLLLLLYAFVVTLLYLQMRMRWQRAKEEVRAGEKRRFREGEIAGCWYTLSTLRMPVNDYVNSLRKYEEFATSSFPVEDVDSPEGRQLSMLEEDLLVTEAELQKTVMRVVCNVHNQLGGWIAANCITLLVNAGSKNGFSNSKHKCVRDSLDRLHLEISKL